MALSRTLAIGGLIAVLLATSACHRHWRHHHRHHLSAAPDAPVVLSVPRTDAKGADLAGIG